MGGNVGVERITETVKFFDLISPKPKWCYLTPLLKRLRRFPVQEKVVVTGGITAQGGFQTAFYSLVQTPGDAMGQRRLTDNSSSKIPVN